ncbi:hypothetical protein ACFZBU_32760 [Embleya sp. NPDC008237]|uniref:hypothetical protein n=1 Tax=Embleya sp. NPDC008237 TaxID=3363978 RepID=UPI0036E7120F
MKIWRYCLSIFFAAIMLSSCGGDAKMSASSVAGRETVKAQIDGYSSRVLDAIALPDHRITNDRRVDQACGGSEAYGVDHFWQLELEGVEAPQLTQAIERLHGYLLAEGWEISTYTLPPATTSAAISATNPRDGYVVWAKGIDGLNRVAVQVSSPCVRLS